MARGGSTRQSAVQAAPPASEEEAASAAASPGGRVRARPPARLPKHFAGGPVARDPYKGPITGKWKAFVLEEKLPVNHNTTKFVFRFDDPTEQYALPACSTLEVGLPKGPAVTRLYTPVTPNGSVGRFELLIKFCPDGKLTPRLFALKEGDIVLARAQPLQMRYRPNQYQHIGLIAAGTGVTPMLQMMREALSDAGDSTRFTLLFCNSRLCDVLLKTELGALEREHQDRLRVVHTLILPPLGWTGEAGYVSAALVCRHMPPPSPSNLICVCGPDRLMESVTGASPRMLAAQRGMRKHSAILETHNMDSMRHGLLADCGYLPQNVHRF
eukprot:TRINITY_DN40753_c0_g1_i1.p1 TRINITY_DN40753_c0_g1~~TRINITY_DN40753_c0_g1_i1.p1  ORF type:complete len:376 (+),score=106.62 TRINITY_DN40753_c0_g1_i1:148-1128(+)